MKHALFGGGAYRVRSRPAPMILSALRSEAITLWNQDNISNKAAVLSAKRRPSGRGIGSYKGD